MQNLFFIVKGQNLIHTKRRWSLPLVPALSVCFDHVTYKYFFSKNLPPPPPNKKQVSYYTLPPHDSHLAVMAIFLCHQGGLC